jgi:hypothetical protein
VRNIREWNIDISDEHEWAEFCLCHRLRYSVAIKLNSESDTENNVISQKTYFKYPMRLLRAVSTAQTSISTPTTP